jgi:hypothetical protein
VRSNRSFDTDAQRRSFASLRSSHRSPVNSDVRCQFFAAYVPTVPFSHSRPVRASPSLATLAMSRQSCSMIQCVDRGTRPNRRSFEKPELFSCTCL